MGVDAAELKKQAAAYAVDLVQSGMIVGLGHGSTAIHVVGMLAEKMKTGQLKDVIGVPSSYQVEEEAMRYGMPLSALDENPTIDLTIDGADEVDPQLNLIKGGGGALLREKVVASVTKKIVVVSDSTKIVPALGKFPLPVEIIPFARTVIEKKIASLGATTKLRMRPDGQPFVTDNGNQILDCSFGRIADPPALARELNSTPGVVEHGLFIGLAMLALVGKGSAVVEVRPKATRPKSARSKPAPRKRPVSKRRKS